MWLFIKKFWKYILGAILAIAAVLLVQHAKSWKERNINKKKKELDNTLKEVKKHKGDRLKKQDELAKYAKKREELDEEVKKCDERLEKIAKTHVKISNNPKKVSERWKKLGFDVKETGD